MSTEAKSLMEVVEKSYQFWVYLFTIFVVCMGVSRWHGRQVWRKHEESRRSDNGLPIAAFFSGSSSEQGFTYTSLFQDGLIGVYIAVTQLMYVVLMLLFDHSIAIFTDPATARGGDIWGQISILMFFPVAMIAFFALGKIVPLRARISFLNCIIPLATVAACVAGSVAAMLLVKDKGLVVGIQLLAVAVLSLCSSYFIGMDDGIRSAEPENNYPLVRVELNQGESFDRVWLYERTDSDYRLVTENGINHIIPAVNVKQIRRL